MCLTFSQPLPNANAKTAEPQHVLVVGGSTSLGVGDSGGHGFIDRAFEDLNQAGCKFVVDNQSLSGASTQRCVSILSTYLQANHPNIIILADGFLNDIFNKVPSSQVFDAVKQEIDLAQSSGAEVFVVTSPVTVASSTYYKPTFIQYMHYEMNLAGKVGHNVHAIDVFDRMTSYIELTHLDCATQLRSDDWHPNALGHEIAGNILYEDLRSYFVSALAKPVSIHKG